MPMFTSPDGRIVFAMETANEGDGNSVVYYDGLAVWDRFSYEAAQGVIPLRPPVAPDPLRQPPVVGPGSPRVIQVAGSYEGVFVTRMYSYWANAWVNGGHAYVFVGHRDGRSRFYKVNLNDGTSAPFDAHVGYGGETEGWGWTQTGEIHLIDVHRLRRVNPFTGQDTVVFDISDTHQGCDLWQSHSSDDGQTHSATVRQIVSVGTNPRIGTVVFRNNHQWFYPVEDGKVLDESAITPDGKFLIIKEDDDNKIVNLTTKEVYWLRDADGALGHSDCGPSFMVGEANLPEPGRCVYVDLPTLTRRDLFQTLNMGYVSVRAGRCLHSGDTHLRLVALDGSGITQLVAHGGSSDYDGRVKANLSPCGRVATYMSGGSVLLLDLS